MVAGSLSLTLAKGPFEVISTVIGATLLFMLLAYDPIGDQEDAASLRQDLAFGAAYVLCIYIHSVALHEPLGPYLRKA